ncbi:MAG: hypothetical protein A3G66_04115 [Candidatus Levybacteria bacterium RIFCSPLOWO2_12_FULL_39_17]|nr:MAG: Methyltransferase [Candidatus Levybacteria bacterium GW2011_GWA1_39_11]OGH45182.1 MAG: hypothetical protein A3H82_03865 [Candidatus Levybacteria bacterium RIFCSPLOWO2_02_FULL_39_26]OGH46871.1 MAG: hypothetical protein A3G66_04115 [Candidatus Levybacteria bacterium RIFCSPLOWO2_12_FULL_39_17]
MAVIKKFKKINYDIFHKTTSIQTKIINNNNFTYRILLKEINKLLDGHEKILDIGCGAGTLSLYYASKDHNVLGIDISKKAVDTAKESAAFLGLKKVKFQQADFPNKIPKEKFDFVIFSEVLEHLEDDQLALDQINNTLYPGGIMFLSTPSIKAPLHRLNLTKKFDKEVGHLRRYSIEELSRLINKSGFRILEVKKSEGVLRNFLFINPVAGKFVRFIKFFLSDVVTFVDNLTIPIFGESNYIVVAKKVKEIKT